MWAEFSFFGLQALLVYYMTKQLGFSQAKSSLIYGAYGAAAFFSPFFGGLIADRWLGRTASVIIGAAMMMFGHFAMAFEALLFPALALVALGNGLFIPPLAVQVGSLYADDDPRKAYAYSAYYMGINLGGLLAPLVCGTLGEALRLALGIRSRRRRHGDRPRRLLQLPAPASARTRQARRRPLRREAQRRSIAGPCRDPVPDDRHGRPVPRRLRAERQRHRALGAGISPIDRSTCSGRA